MAAGAGSAMDGEQNGTATGGSLRKLLDGVDQVNVDSASRDGDVGNLLNTPGGQSELSEMMTIKPTETYHALWLLGAASMQGLTKTCLTPSAWSSEDARLKCVKDTFTLSLATLLEPGEDSHSQKAELGMQIVARLMASNAAQLAPSMDTDNLAIILDCLNLGNTVRLRSQATLTTAKLIEASPKKSQAMLKEYVTSKIAKHTNDDIVSGFSAAAAVFPITPDSASALFLTPGFIDDLAAVVRKSVSTRLRYAALELLSAACINKDCRASIRSSCTTWLQDVVRDRPSDRDAAMAALVLSKTAQETPDIASEHALALYRDILVSSDNQETAQTAVEGLAYSSTQATLKEQLINDATLMKRIIQLLNDSPQQGPLMFGGLTVICHLTSYQTDVSAEQKRMAQLKAYANQTKLAEPSPLDSATRVTARATKLIELGVIPLLVKCAKHASPTALDLAVTIALHLTKERKHCGTAIQQGVLDILLPTASYGGSDATLLRAKTTAAQALARTLLPVDPTLIFYNQNVPKARSVATAVRAFKTLLDDKDIEDPRIAFEALQALTNLASMGEKVSEYITECCFSSVEYYLSSNRSAQQQAAIELISNLSSFDACCKMFVSEKDPVFPTSYNGTTDTAHLPEARFLQIRALTEDDTRGTRLAAMASVFNITQQGKGATMLIKAPSGLERLLPCLEATHPPSSDRPDVDMRARAAGTVLNLLQHGDAMTRMKDLDIESRLRKSMISESSGQVAHFAAEALSILNKP